MRVCFISLILFYFYSCSNHSTDFKTKINSTDNLNELEIRLKNLEQESANLEYEKFLKLPQRDRCYQSLEQIRLLAEILNKHSVNSIKDESITPGYINDLVQHCNSYCQTIDSDNLQICEGFSLSINLLLIDQYLDNQYKIASILSEKNSGVGCFSKLLLDLRMSNNLVCGSSGSLNKAEKILKVDCLKNSKNCSFFKKLNELMSDNRLGCSNSK